MQRSIRVMSGSVVLAAPEKMTDNQFYWRPVAYLQKV